MSNSYIIISYSYNYFYYYLLVKNAIIIHWDSQKNILLEIFKSKYMPEIKKEKT